jgi:hypothetical protein
MFELVEQWQQSGMSQKRFILEHDVKLDIPAIVVLRQFR